MPDHIQLQFDNKSRDINHVTVLRFLNFLNEVLLGMGVHFFIVGHTRTDLEQRLSCVGPVIAGAQELGTPSDFAGVIQDRYEVLNGHELHVQALEIVRDWKAWLLNFGDVLCGRIGKRSARAFKFLRDKRLDPSWRRLSF